MNTHASMNKAFVETASGELCGGATPVGCSFKGIPHGGSTAGVNRFFAPSPAPTWSGIREARDFGLRCPQNDGVIKPANAWIRDVRPTGEDCLSLNVWTPSLDDAAERPVMVWLHGGGYSRGTSGAPGLDGSHLAQAGELVVVTLNHRLNTFGNTYFGDEDERFADSGNVGVLDIVQALEWVRDNIASFGGDAGNVTIFGQSGGGSKVAVMMTMASARGLFHKAIIQSSSSHLQLATKESAARPDMNGRDLYHLITSDHMYRRNNVEAAERKVKQGGAPVFLYEFTWKTPVLGGMLRSPHTWCIPFAFGNIDIAKDFVGEGPEQTALTEKVMGAWMAFARTGNPNHASLTEWPAFNLETRPTMTFDKDTRVENNPRPEELAWINACPRFVSDAQWAESEANDVHENATVVTA